VVANSEEGEEGGADEGVGGGDDVSWLLLVQY
jgi:hypothetical protein